MHMSSAHVLLEMLNISSRTVLLELGCEVCLSCSSHIQSVGESCMETGLSPLRLAAALPPSPRPRFPHTSDES